MPLLAPVVTPGFPLVSVRVLAMRVPLGVAPLPTVHPPAAPYVAPMTLVTSHLTPLHVHTSNHFGDHDTTRVVLSDTLIIDVPLSSVGLSASVPLSLTLCRCIDTVQ
jgi:hypothetical protein